MLNRRKVLQHGGFGAALLGLPRIAFAATARTDKRFLFVIQRGARGDRDAGPTGDRLRRTSRRPRGEIAAGPSRREFPLLGAAETASLRGAAGVFVQA